MFPGTSILQVGAHSETAEKVQDFYAQSPFPNFDDHASLIDLVDIKNKNAFLSNLKEQLGLGKKVIEVGSGTSQLSIMLAHGTNNQVVAFDATLESLRLGEAFARDYDLPNCNFVLGDIFSDPFKDNFFDLVWCSGVLHHTNDPEGGFEIISKWLKKDGIIIIGLYNKIGRLRTNFRQFIFKCMRPFWLAKKVIFFLDPIIRAQTSRAKKDAWFQDQYLHPIESKHTLNEILKWFDANGIMFVSSLPTCTGEPVNMKNIFKIQKRGSFLSRLFSQIASLFGPSGSEGGLFLVIGRKM
jgi:SAM-dependent methyltransferase